ncbi:hypothetical protein DQ384_23285 [Sphaerisporangium album]|uniref:Uncharacterized protein n=1 Tax=Sphaerisporangium album TaxID=509200 RepID=A0A367FE67_9ACTN|nr:hypothetical protein [Sphaerisporangium album]RCG28666.1 hypothetical protein DQ384_23285 [Sphaerisporangium album]
MTDKRLLAAVRDNAEWCDAMCRAYNLPGTFTASLWSNPRRTPPLYPDAVTLTPQATRGEVLAAIDLRSPGATVKDSFARLDLRDAGFGVLFEAQWIARPPGPGTPLDDLRTATGDRVTWSEVTTASELRDWETGLHGGHDGGWFRPALLTDPAVTLVAGRVDGDLVCGSVLTTGGEVVGLSNVFAYGCDPDAPWEGSVALAAHLFPGRPITGYEHGDDLAPPARQGFVPIGPLQVWTT